MARRENREKVIDSDAVDLVFEELDIQTHSMIEKWKRETFWADNEDLKVYLRLSRDAKRVNILDKTVPDRICPICKKVEINNHNWRVNEDTLEALCHICFNNNFPQFKSGEDEWELLHLIHEIFYDPMVRYRVDGEKLQQVRGILGVSQSALAEAIDVTPSITHLYEEGHTKTITRERVIKCMQLFKEYFLERLRQLGYPEHELERYKWYKPEIVEIE